MPEDEGTAAETATDPFDQGQQQQLDGTQPVEEDPQQPAPKPTETVDFWRSKAREQEKRAKANADAAKRLKELEDANKSELEKLTDRASGAEERASTAELAGMRLDVALDVAPDDMSKATIRKLAKRLSGSTREELEADAKELFAEFAPPAKGDDDTGEESKAGAERPKEKLGSVPLPNSDNIRLDDETDPRKLIEKFPRL